MPGNFVNMENAKPLMSLAGVPAGTTVATFPFVTRDGARLELTRFSRGTQHNEAVLLVHGLTQSSDMFLMPEHVGLARALLDNGVTDVWCIDTRMSKRFPYNGAVQRYNLDDVALHDYPAALSVLREAIGARPLHVICHCVGSITFSMSLFAEKIANIRSLIVNSVCLTPHVPGWSKLKLTVVPTALEYILQQPYASPTWHTGHSWVGRAIAGVTNLVHRECDVPECKMLSLMWGAGHPALYLHENLAEETHKRIADLHGVAGMHPYRHVLKMAQAQEAVKFAPTDPRYSSLPDRYLAHAANVQTPMLLVSGDQNRVFTDSNKICFERLEQAAPGRHKFHTFANYGHNDVFIGKNVARDIFPTFFAFLASHGVAIRNAA